MEGYNCSCADGFRLDSDGYTCNGIQFVLTCYSRAYIERKQNWLKKEIYIDIYIYINSRNNENDEDNNEDNVNDDDGSIKWNYPCKALIIFDEQIILNKKKDYS